MMKACKHRDQEELEGPDPDEVELLKQGICPLCDLKARRNGAEWSCACCGIQWRVKSNSLILTASIRVML